MIPANMPRGAQHGHPNLLHTNWKNPWIAPNTLAQDNVLDYFCVQGNPFYDLECNNQTIKMQNIARPLEECLVNMTGIQYVVWSAQAPLYVICKQRRNGPQQVTPLAYYYIINGVVYQSPDLYTFAQSRLLGAIDPLRKAFEETMQYRRFSMAKGYYWEFKEKSSAYAEQKVEKEKPQQARSTHFQTTRADQLMKLLIEQFPPSSSLEIIKEPEETSRDDSTKMEIDSENKAVAADQPGKTVLMQPPSTK